MIRPLLATWLRELRFAVRRARGRPGPALSSIVMLGLGIGASTAAFSAVRTVLLEPLPVRAQDELVVLWQRSRARDFDHVPFGPGDLAAVERSAVFQGVAAFETAGVRTGLGDGIDGSFPVRQARIGGDWFGVLGVEPVIGRLLSIEDDRVGASPVVVISRSFWVDRYAASPGAIGATLQVDDVSFTVVGIAPSDFDFPEGAQVWATLRGSNPAWNELDVQGVELDLIGRLHPGTTLQSVVAEVSRALLEEPAVDRSTATGTRFEVTGVGFQELILGPVRPMLLATLAGTLVLLLAACGNASLLFLASGAASSRDAAIRRAIGASTAASVRPLVADGVLRAVAGWGAGLGLAWLLLHALTPLVPVDLVRTRGLALGVGSMVLAGVVAVPTMVLAATLAARWLTAGSPARALAGSHRVDGRPRGRRVRGVIVAGQVTLAVVTGTGAVLLTRTVRNLEGLERGFDPVGLHVVDLRTPYPFFEPPEGAREEFARVSEALSGRVGISGVSPTFSAPMLLRGGIDVAPRIDGQDADAARENPYVGFDAVLPGYFEVIGTDVVDGRAFNAEDGPGGAPSIIVNTAAARALWPGRPPLGRQVNLGGLSRDEWRTVIGVVDDQRFRTFPDVRPAVYVPLPQYDRFVPTRLLVRSDADAGHVRDAVDEAFRGGSLGARVLTVRAMEEIMREPLRRPLFASAVLTFVALTTMALSGLGVHGVITATVAARRRELGVRIALGAEPRHVLSSVLTSVLRIGLPGALAGALLVRLLAAGADALLFGVSARDPRLLVAVVLAGTAASVLAASVPAARALRTDPGESLRVE